MLGMVCLMNSRSLTHVETHMEIQKHNYNTESHTLERAKASAHAHAPDRINGDEAAHKQQAHACKCIWAPSLRNASACACACACANVSRRECAGSYHAEE